MHLRPLQPTDLPTLATLASEAFATDELFALLGPKAHQEPAAFRRYMLQQLRIRSEQAGNVGIVCVAPRAEVAAWRDGGATPQELEETAHGTAQDRDDGEVLLGLAFWRHVGATTPTTDPTWRTTNHSLLARLNTQLLNLERAYDIFFQLNASLSYPVLRRWDYVRTLPDPDDPALYTDARIHLGFLAVRPCFQRKGVGRLLIGWGKERARKEGVVVGLHGSVMGEGLYKSCGFQTVAWHIFEAGEGTDAIQGGQLMVWEPEGLEGRWVMKGKAWVERVAGRKAVDGRWKAGADAVDLEEPHEE